MTRDTYAARVRALARGELTDEQAAALAEAGAARLVKIEISEDKADRCATAFSLFQGEIRSEARSRDRIARVALALADALRASGESEFFTTADAEFWAEALKETSGKHTPPPDAGMSLERYLRGMVATLTTDKQWAGTLLAGIRNPTGRRPDLTGFVVRWLLREMDLWARWGDLEFGRKQHGRNAWCARLATTLLGSEVTNNEVAKLAPKSVKVSGPRLVKSS